MMEFINQPDQEMAYKTATPEEIAEQTAKKKYTD